MFWRFSNLKKSFILLNGLNIFVNKIYKVCNTISGTNQDGNLFNFSFKKSIEF